MPKPSTSGGFVPSNSLVLLATTLIPAPGGTTAGPTGAPQEARVASQAACMAASPREEPPVDHRPGDVGEGEVVDDAARGGVVGLGPADHAPRAVALEDDRLVHDDRLAVRGGQHVDEVAGCAASMAAWMVS